MYISNEAQFIRYASAAGYEAHGWGGDMVRFRRPGGDWRVMSRARAVAAMRAVEVK